MRSNRMNKYSFNVRWSDEDVCYVAVCPDFPGLSGLGETAEEALAELQVALTASIETYQEEGWPLPQPHTMSAHSGKLLVRMPRSLHTRLAQQAEVEGVSLNTLVITILAEATGVV